MREHAVSRMAERGLRVVAIAVRDLAGSEIPESAEATEVESDAAWAASASKIRRERASRIPLPRAGARASAWRW